MGTAAQFRSIAESLVKDDAITKAILKRNTTLDDGWWESLGDGARYFSAQEAIAAKIATGIGHFAPPANVQIKVL